MSSTEYVVEAQIQEIAFYDLYDVDRRRLKVRIGDDKARSRLDELNGLAATTLLDLEAATMLSAGTTICQGACLLAAVLEKMEVMESAWTGPDCPLKQHGARTIIGLRGNKKIKVQFYSSCV